MAGEAGFETEGLDMDPKCVELDQRFGMASITSPADYLDSFPDASVDVISCLHVLEHVENPKRLLAGMRRVSRRFVVVAVPNLRCFHKLNSRSPTPVNKGHLQGWDRETLRNLGEIHCGLDFVAFISDMTKFPSLDSRIARLFGSAVEKWISLKIFSRLWPGKCISIIALFKVPDEPKRE